jgi:tetratricopeptide (TPR) repeat protein
MNRLMLVLSLVSALGVALAQPAVEKLMNDGKYQEAYEAGLKQATAEGLVLAAKAGSYYAYYQAPDNQKAEWFGRAEAAAKKAIQIDGNDAGAYFEVARAQGRLSQYRGILDSLSLANTIKENLDKALRLNPKLAGAKVALALWNASLASRGVGWLYGADGGRAVPLINEAIVLEPQVIIHKVELANLLSQQNRKDEARKLYEAALAIAPKTAADKFDLERAKRELAALK